ncbi:MAG: cytochrome b N-terminal domain-containing protein [Candidatus Adiutrix sp.]|nr:cytochrome b N-terminal domain-containing protein [Candidatus Adiutrix sp.]
MNNSDSGAAGGSRAPGPRNADSGVDSEEKSGKRSAFPWPAPGWKPGRPDFGGLLLLVFLLQAVSGFYLAMFYQPTPAEAWDSLTFIENEVAGGGFFRALHRWGALVSALLLMLHAVHMIWNGAYRKPRRWLSGLPLLLLFAAFVVTGYLLPWDFRAYWSVLTMGNWLEPLPLFSEALDFWLLSAGSPGGAAPLARWFVLHGALLPLLTCAGLAFHIRSLGRPPRLGTAGGRLPAAGLLLLLGWLAAFGIQKQIFADPVTTSPIPQPDWLFLMFFQVTRYCQNNLEMLAVFWLPMTVILCLMLLPFIDRGPRGRRQWLKWSLVVGSLSLCLTLGVFTHHTGTTTPVWSCQACHKEGFGKSFSRPPGAVKDFSKRYDNKWLAMHYRYPQYFWMMDAEVPGW